jgi:hypothetical protein
LKKQKTSRQQTKRRHHGEEEEEEEDACSHSPRGRPYGSTVSLITMLYPLALCVNRVVDDFFVDANKNNIHILFFTTAATCSANLCWTILIFSLQKAKNKMQTVSDSGVATKTAVGNLEFSACVWPVMGRSAATNSTRLDSTRLDSN